MDYKRRNDFAECNKFFLIYFIFCLLVLAIGLMLI